MSFLYPNFLWLLIPLLILLMQKSRDITIKTHTIILILLIITLSSPVIEGGKEFSSIKSRDIIIALDISYSMSATDISPSRYEFAKQTINHFLDINPTDNIMLVGFTTNPLILSPPTTDHELIKMALDSLNPKYILTKGTSLERLFDKLIAINSQNKTLILITDGGEEGDIISLSSKLKSSNISLVILALGSIQGTTIITPDGSFLKDNRDNLIISRINPILKPLASFVSGEYLLASSSAQNTAQNINKSISLNATKEIKKEKRHDRQLYQIPLFIALILFLILHTRFIKYLFIFYSLLGVNTHASFWDIYHLHSGYSSYIDRDFKSSSKIFMQIEDISLQSQIALANSFYKTENYKKSIEIYKSIKSTSPKTKQLLYYNIANSYAMLELYKEAKRYYIYSLQLGEDNDTKHNLNLIIFKEEKQKLKGISKPQSQSDANAPKKSKEDKDENKNKPKEESQSDSNSGGGKNKNQSKPQKTKLTIDTKPKKPKHPLSSKVYDLINKGYINETKPW
ncbi:MAG: VWA domain-containing protein [Sulfurovum sp.]